MAPDKLNVVIITDFSKMGTLQVEAMKRHVSLISKLIGRAPKSTWTFFSFCDGFLRHSRLGFGPLAHGKRWRGQPPQGLEAGPALRAVEPTEFEPCRVIEDKLYQQHLELRQVSIGVDLSGLHGNSERPAFYHGWICVPDTFLPPKGTAYRSNKHEADAVKATQINDFTTSELWRLQGLVGSFPLALSEHDFRVPAAKSFLISNDARRNLTDVQETSQWMAGEEFAKRVLESMLGFLPESAF